MKKIFKYTYNPDTDKLGEGAFSAVYKATDTALKRTVALKIYKKEETSKYDILTEINKMINVNHKNLINYYDAFLTEDGLQIGVTEYANKGNFEEFLKSDEYLNSENQNKILKKIFLDILTGLKFLHEEKKIVHRDIKPKNILISEKNNIYTAKIADFGTSKILKSDSEAVKSSMMVITWLYAAPEQLNKKKFGINQKISFNLDLWAFGAIIYSTFYGHSHYFESGKEPEQDEVIGAILDTDKTIKFDKIPEPYKTIAKKCLIHKAKNRIQTTDEIIKIIQEYNFLDDTINKIKKLVDFREFDKAIELIKQVQNKKSNDKKNNEQIIQESKQEQENIKIDTEDTQLKNKDEIEKIINENDNSSSIQDNSKFSKKKKIIVFSAILISIILGIISIFAINNYSTKKKYNNFIKIADSLYKNNNYIDAVPYYDSAYTVINETYPTEQKKLCADNYLQFAKDTNYVKFYNICKDNFPTTKDSVDILLNKTGVKDTFFDKRDSTTYTIIKVGKQWWFAENLKFEIYGSLITKKHPGNGRYYSHNVAKKAIPEGWHLPTKQEWDTLINIIPTVSEMKKIGFKIIFDGMYFDGYHDSEFRSFGYYWADTYNYTYEQYYFCRFKNDNIVIEPISSSAKMNVFCVKGNPKPQSPQKNK